MRVKVIRGVFWVASAVGALLMSAVSTHAVTIDVGSAVGFPGNTVTFQVKLNTEGSVVGGTTNDIAFDPATPIADKGGGVPACDVNPTFALSGVSFIPAGCSPGTTCVGIRAVILPFGGAIPNGSVLYTCTVQIAATATALHSYPLTCSNATSSTPNAMPLTTTCSNGEISVAGAGGGGGGGGGCAVGDTTQGGVAWMVLLPLMMMVWRRASLR
jgi:hypothetical protein